MYKHLNGNLQERKIEKIIYQQYKLYMWKKCLFVLQILKQIQTFQYIQGYTHSYKHLLRISVNLQNLSFIAIHVFFKIVYVFLCQSLCNCTISSKLLADINCQKVWFNKSSTTFLYNIFKTFLNTHTLISVTNVLQLNINVCLKDF